LETFKTALEDDIFEAKVYTIMNGGSLDLTNFLKALAPINLAILKRAMG
jgi:hypothetical protein